jgi:ketosteroid isomerase-like protein
MLSKNHNQRHWAGETGGEMVLVPARGRIGWLALGLSAALAFIGLSSLVASSAVRGAGTQSKTAVAPAGHDTSVEGDEIRGMIVKYAKSIDDANTLLASEIWSDSPEVSFIHPLGHEHGLQQIKENFYKHLMGDTFSQRKLSIHDVSAHVYGETAWAEFYWDFAAKFRKDGSPITTHGRETQVYRKEQGRWRLVHVHYSGMPVTEERKGF